MSYLLPNSQSNAREVCRNLKGGESILNSTDVVESSLDFHESKSISKSIIVISSTYLGTYF